MRLALSALPKSLPLTSVPANLPCRFTAAHHPAPIAQPPARPALRSTSAAGAATGCMSKRAMVRIGTHSGSFHCDEALGCFMLRQTAAFKDADIVRTRDPELLKASDSPSSQMPAWLSLAARLGMAARQRTQEHRPWPFTRVPQSLLHLQELDIIIDVGGVYDDKTHRYDHHQREFTEKFGHGFECTKLSSAGERWCAAAAAAAAAGMLGEQRVAATAWHKRGRAYGCCTIVVVAVRCAGLVYRHFGREVIANILSVPVDHPDLEAIYLHVYKVTAQTTRHSEPFCARPRRAVASECTRVVGVLAHGGCGAAPSPGVRAPCAACLPDPLFLQTFIESVDAIDNGVQQWDGGQPPKYINNTTLAARVGQLNPWCAHAHAPRHPAACAAPGASPAPRLRGRGLSRDEGGGSEPAGQVAPGRSQVSGRAWGVCAGGTRTALRRCSTSASSKQVRRRSYSAAPAVRHGPRGPRQRAAWGLCLQSSSPAPCRLSLRAHGACSYARLPMAPAPMRVFPCAAVQLAGAEFTEAVTYAYRAWLPGRQYVKESLEQRLQVHPGGQVVKLVRFCPWKDHLYDLEKELGLDKPILYVLVSGG